MLLRRCVELPRTLALRTFVLHLEVHCILYWRSRAGSVKCRSFFFLLSLSFSACYWCTLCSRHHFLRSVQSLAKSSDVALLLNRQQRLQTASIFASLNSTGIQDKPSGTIVCFESKHRFLTLALAYLSNLKNTISRRKDHSCSLRRADRCN